MGIENRLAFVVNGAIGNPQVRVMACVLDDMARRADDRCHRGINPAEFLRYLDNTYFPLAHVLNDGKPILTPEMVSYFRDLPWPWGTAFNPATCPSPDGGRIVFFRAGAGVGSAIGRARMDDAGTITFVDSQPILTPSLPYLRKFGTVGIEDPRAQKTKNGISIFATLGRPSYYLDGRGAITGIWKVTESGGLEWQGALFAGKHYAKNAGILPQEIDGETALLFRANGDILSTATAGSLVGNEWADPQTLLSHRDLRLTINGNSPSKVGLAEQPYYLPGIGYLVFFHARHGEGATGHKFVYIDRVMLLNKDDPLNPQKIKVLAQPVDWPRVGYELNGLVPHALIMTDGQLEEGVIHRLGGAGDTAVCARDVILDELFAGANLWLGPRQV